MASVYEVVWISSLDGSQVRIELSRIVVHSEDLEPRS